MVIIQYFVFLPENQPTWQNEFSNLAKIDDLWFVMTPWFFVFWCSNLIVGSGSTFDSGMCPMTIHTCILFSFYFSPLKHWYVSMCSCLGTFVHVVVLCFIKYSLMECGGLLVYFPLLKKYNNFCMHKARSQPLVHTCFLVNKKTMWK